MYRSQAMLATKAPAINPESDEAMSVPSLNLYSFGPASTNSSLKAMLNSINSTNVNALIIF